MVISVGRRREWPIAPLNEVFTKGGQFGSQGRRKRADVPSESTEIPEVDEVER
jgi:hypothetical protein